MGKAENELEALARAPKWSIPELLTLTAALERLDRETSALSELTSVQGEAAEAAKRRFAELSKKITEAEKATEQIARVIALANSSRQQAITQLDDLPSGQMPQFWRDTIKLGGTISFPGLGTLAADKATDAINSFLGNNREKAAQHAIDQLILDLNESSHELDRAIETIPQFSEKGIIGGRKRADPDDNTDDTGGHGSQKHGSGGGSIGEGGSGGTLPGIGGGGGGIGPEIPIHNGVLPTPQPYPVPHPAPQPVPLPNESGHLPPGHADPAYPQHPGGNGGGGEEGNRNGGWGDGSGPGGRGGYDAGARGWNDGGWTTPRSGGLYGASGVSVDGSTGGSLPGSVGFGDGGGSGGGGGLSGGLLAGGGVAGGLAGGALGSRLARSGAGGLAGGDGTGGMFGGAGSVGGGASGTGGAGGAGAAGSRNGLTGAPMGMGGMGGGAGNEKRRAS